MTWADPKGYIRWYCVCGFYVQMTGMAKAMSPRKTVSSTVCVCVCFCV